MVGHVISRKTINISHKQTIWVFAHWICSGRYAYMITTYMVTLHIWLPCILRNKSELPHAPTRAHAHVGTPFCISFNPFLLWGYWFTLECISYINWDMHFVWLHFMILFGHNFAFNVIYRLPDAFLKLGTAISSGDKTVNIGHLAKICSENLLTYGSVY